MKQRFSCTYLLVVAAVLSGCGGSSNSNNSASTCEAATTTAPYLASSYDSCNASDQSLVGLWMIVSDYHITKNNVERDRQQRTIMAITEQGDGFNAFVCNEDPELRNISLSRDDAVLSFYDDRAEDFLDLAIESNTRMQGEYFEGFTTTVHSSSATAIKISDSLVPGSLHLDFIMDGNSYSGDNLPVACFLQVKGTTVVTDPDLYFNAENLYFFVQINNNDVVEEAFIGVGISADPADGPDIDMDFSETFNGFNSEDPDNSTITYVENSNTSIRLNVNAVDDFNANDVLVLDFAAEL